MTETDWLTAEDPDPLLRWLRKSSKHRPTPRKMALFACACARRLGPLAADDVMASGLDLAERLAEGTASQDEYRSFLQRAMDGGSQWPFTHITLWAVRIPVGLSGTSPEGTARDVAGEAARWLGPDEPAEQCRLLREVIGNPYRPVKLDPAWRTRTILSLAQAAYEDRELSGGSLNPTRLAVLADALLDVGCDDEQLLAHLHDPGPHWRGCFALDAILGKE